MCEVDVFCTHSHLICHKKILYAYLVHPIWLTCSGHHILLDLTALENVSNYVISSFPYLVLLKFPSVHVNTEVFTYTIQDLLLFLH